MAKILYVEDNEDNIYLLTRRLARLGHHVEVARDGEEGVQRVKLGQPDLVIMDLVLPRLDGWEATRRIKADPATASIPVLALSASAMPGDEDSARRAGCEDFEPKPVDFQRLHEKIERLLAAGGCGGPQPDSE